MHGVSVSVELQKKIDSKDAKVGDEVVAKTTAEAQLSDGTRLPKGSRLVGHVTDAQARTRENHDAHLTFAFDHAVLKDGREVPIQAMMRSIAVPVMAAPGSADGIMGAGAGPRADAPGGGVGLAGNGPSNVRPTVPATGGPAPAAGGLNTATSGIDGSVNGAMNPNGALGTGANGAAGLDGERGAGPTIPVGNLAGVTFANVSAAAGAGNGEASGAAGVSMAITLIGHGKNVTLDSGAQMTVMMAPR